MPRPNVVIYKIEVIKKSVQLVEFEIFCNTHFIKFFTIPLKRKCKTGKYIRNLYYYSYLKVEITFSLIT